MRVRRALETIILLVSVVAGLAIVGSCGMSGGSSKFSAGGFAAGVFVALILVGAVFLFTTMSRDVRLLRVRFTEEAAAEERLAGEAAVPDTDVQA